MAVLTDPINEEKAKILYNEGSKHFDLGTYEEYLQKMGNPEKRKLLYDNLSTKFDLGTYEEYEEKLKKKDLGGEGSGTSSGTDGARTAAKKFEVPTLATPYYSYRDAMAKADKAKAEERKKSLVEFYDKREGFHDQDPLKIYKNWATENGALDRITYLEDKARGEVEDARRGLSNIVMAMNQLQEDKRLALEKGDTEEVFRLNKLIQAGTEEIRNNKDAAEGGLRTETGLQLHEEAIGFASEMLNAKMEDLMSNPEVEKKLTTLDSLSKAIKKSKPDAADIKQVDQHNNLIEQYNALLEDEDVQKAKAISDQAAQLVESEKDLARKFPNQFAKRVEKKSRQEAIDGMFAAGGQTKVGLVNQLGRSATGFLADIAKIWTVADFNNEYGPADKWADIVDKATDYVNESAFPVPSDYNKPMMYQDDKGNTVFRSDLILPKTAKVAGDMAGLLFGAGKLSAMGKAAGLSSKVSNGIGLFTSSYLQTHDEYKKAGESAGLNPSDAAWFATSSAALTSALEMISPQKYLWSADDLANSVARNIASGMSRREAMKQSMKFIGGQIGTENLQEITQTMGDKLMESGVNLLTGNNHFEHNGQDLFNEAVETMVVTTLVAGAPAAASTSVDNLNRNKNYRDAIRLAAENKQKYVPIIQNALRQTNANPAEIKKIFDAINAVKVPKEGTPLYLIHGQTVDRAAIEEKLKKGDISGIYVANDNALEGQLNTVANGEKIKSPPKVNLKPKKEKSADGNVTEEDPVEFAKRVAKAKVDILVKSGDVKYDGKRVTVLTDHGEQQMAIIMEEMSRAAAGAPVKSNPAIDAAIEKQNRGEALTLEEAELLESTEDVPEFEVVQPEPVKFQVGITSATDKVPEVKALMDEARAFAEQEQFDKAEEAFNKVLDIGEKKIMEDLAHIPGAKITLNRTKGNFFNYTEPTFSATLEVDEQHRDEAFAALAKSGEELSQDAIHISEVREMKDGEELGVEQEDGSVLEPNIDILFDKPITDKQFSELVKATQDEAGLAGFTLHPDKKGINLYNISKFTPHAEFSEKVKALAKILDDRGLRGNVKASVRALRNVGKSEAGATRSYEQVRSNFQETPETQRIRDIIEKATKALAKINPGFKAVFYRGAEQGRKALKDIGSRAKLKDGARGFYAHAQGVAGIDLSAGDATTAFHESIHPIVDALKELNPELFKKLSQEAAQHEVELEDGSRITYAEYMGGNKEEALVELLADFADGKFDGPEHKSTLQKVKELISEILEALGLKSEDFNINLDKIEDVKEFADQLATAISKGKTINLDTKAKAASKRRGGVSAQAPATGKKKKLNRTAKRIAADKETQFKQIRTSVIRNPEKHSYTPQELKKKVKNLEGMTLEEVVVETQSTDKLLEALNEGNQYAVISAIELLRRKAARKEDTRPIFKKLREIGTSVGQLLRQFGELKTRTPEGIVNTVLGNIESLGLTPTQEQTEKLTELAEKHIKALADVDEKRAALIDDASDANEKALDKAEDDLAKSFFELNEYSGKITPSGLDSLIPMILQGNLLVVKSIVKNVVGNILFQPFHQAEQFAGDLITYVGKKIKGEPVANPFEMFFGSVLHGMIAFGQNIPVAVRDVIRGRGAEYTSTLEVRRNLKPLLALQQIFTKAGRDTLPVNAKGKVPISVYIEKAIEGTAGWPAEAMFRMLYLGDKPFREAARAAGAYRMFAERGGGNNKAFRKFMANASKGDIAKMEEAAQEATSSNERTLAKIGDGFTQWVGRNIDVLADKSPNEGFRHAVKVILKTLAKANTPYIRVPANLLQYLIELALPSIPLYAGLMYSYRGAFSKNQNHPNKVNYGRKAAEMFTRAAAGYMLQGAADLMYDAGILIASGEDDEENERQLKHEVARPNGFNLDAYARWRAGGDPTYQEGDDVREFLSLGYLGMYFAYRAEFNESLKKDLKKTRKELDFMSEAVEQFNSVVGAALEMSFLQGTYNMLQSFDRGGFQTYGAELMNTLSAIAIPNNMSVLSRANSDYVLRAKDEEALNGFFERQKVKIFPTLQAIGLMEGHNIENVYPIIGMFGEPAQQVPEGKNPFMYHFFNITNTEKISDPVALEVFNLSKKINDVPITAPTPRVKIGLNTYTMTEGDYTYAQMIAGQYKRIVLSNLMANEKWKTYDDNVKKTIMERVNQKGNELAKKKMLTLIYDSFNTGKAVADNTMGTYRYLEPSEFDYNFAVDFFKGQ